MTVTGHPWFDGRDWLRSDWHRKHVAAGTERVSRRGECYGPLEGAAKKRALAAGEPPFEYAGTRAIVRVWDIQQWNVPSRAPQNGRENAAFRCAAG